MTAYFLSAIALLCVLEGILPFLSPRLYRIMMRRLSEQEDKPLRTFGFVLMLIGVSIIYIIHQ